MAIFLRQNFTQYEFDEALLQLHKKLYVQGEDKIYDIEKTILVECGWDFNDEGKTAPYFWYNKKELDKRGIKYGLDN